MDRTMDEVITDDYIIFLKNKLNKSKKPLLKTFILLLKGYSVVEIAKIINKSRTSVYYYIYEIRDIYDKSR